MTSRVSQKVMPVPTPWVKNTKAAAALVTADAR